MDMSHSSTAGAMVVGGDYQGLGIVRSLGRHGVPVCVVDDEPCIARFSRHCTHSVRVDDLRDQRHSVDVIMDLGRRLGLNGWVLYPTREEAVAAFAHHRDELSQLYRVPTPDWETVRWAWDKRNTYRLAEQLDVAVPQTWYPGTLAAVRAIDANPPFVIKPAIKENFVYVTKQKAWRADSRAELVELFEKASSIVGTGEIMVQELIPGGGSHQLAYCAFFKHQRAVGSMVARRLRQHPPLFGRASTYVESVDVPELEELSLRLLSSIDYYGLVELEYKLDARDGKYKLLDFNARTWGYHSLGPAAGVDFPYLLFADQTGLPVEGARARAGVRWMRLITDLPTAAVEFRSGCLSLRSYLRSLKAVNVEAVFSGRDPLPGLVEIAMLPYLAATRGF
jgi:predicted ATP-grasp superfamily ATP-dependent carboligase